MTTTKTVDISILSGEYFRVDWLEEEKPGPDIAILQTRSLGRGYGNDEPAKDEDHDHNNPAVD